MNIGVIGGGATGLLTSYYLNETHNVTLYVRRKKQKQMIIKKGIKEVTSHHPQSVNVKQLNELMTEQLLIICVKSMDVNDVLQIIHEKAIKSPILFLQNGMGHVPLFKSIKNEVYVGVIEHGVVRKNDVTFHHLGKGQLKISSIKKGVEANNLAKQLSSQTFPVQFVDDWDALLKEKLIVNAVINPLTALFDVDNRYIIENSYIVQLARKLCEEVATILNLDYESSWERVEKIATSTGNNTSSMRSDMINKRETEIDAILGYLIEKSNDNYALIDMMYKGIKALEERNKL